MKDIKSYLLEKINIEDNNIIDEASESIKSEKDFRDYAENKFKTVFGDKLDEDKMKKIVDGIVDKYGKDGNWGQAVGVLNKSFGK
jgi:hypothetical protein